MAGPGRNIWPAKPSRNNVGRVPLYIIGVDGANERVYSRLAIDDPGPGFCHFPDSEAYDERYFAGLTSEKVVTKYSKGFPVRQWTPKSRNLRNEPLDCRVYALAALIGLNANMERLAARLKARLEKVVPAGDAETEPPAVLPPFRRNAPKVDPPPGLRRGGRPRRLGGFVGRWKM
jgi:phage terminase large subunit GpA-like protein